jgi:phenylpropionate dioxygenase-like ring-hydroxylating dioxygenase large terminal subunit
MARDTLKDDSGRRFVWNGTPFLQGKEILRHRAAPLVTQPEGKASRLHCRYHGWTYDLAGRLRGTPEFDRVTDLCGEDNGLAEVKVAD